MLNPLNKRLRVDKSLGFASGEVVFEKEGSGKDPRLAGEHQNFMRRGNQEALRALLRKQDLKSREIQTPYADMSASRHKPKL